MLNNYKIHTMASLNTRVDSYSGPGPEHQLATISNDLVTRADHLSECIVQGLVGHIGLTLEILIYTQTESLGSPLIDRYDADLKVELMEGLERLTEEILFTNLELFRPARRVEYKRAYDLLFNRYGQGGCPFPVYSVCLQDDVGAYLAEARKKLVLHTEQRKAEVPLLNTEINDSILEYISILRRMRISVHSDLFLEVGEGDMVMLFIREILAKRKANQEIISLSEEWRVDLVDLEFQLGLLQEQAATDMLVTANGPESRYSLQGQFITLWEQVTGSVEVETLLQQIFPTPDQRILVASLIKTDENGFYTWTDTKLAPASTLYNLINALREYLSEVEEE